VSPHPNGASRVLRITLLSRAEQFESLSTALSAILPPADLDALTAPNGHGAHRSFWITSPAGNKVEIFVSKPATEEQERWVGERGKCIYAVTIGINKPGGSEVVLEGKSRLILTPLD
jgi:hypothetical protein